MPCLEVFGLLYVFLGTNSGGSVRYESVVWRHAFDAEAAFSDVRSCCDHVVVSQDSFGADTCVRHLCFGSIHIMEAMRPEQEEIRYGLRNMFKGQEVLKGGLTPRKGDQKNLLAKNSDSCGLETRTPLSPRTSASVISITLAVLGAECSSGVFASGKEDDVVEVNNRRYVHAKMMLIFWSQPLLVHFWV
ncbi:unnamed protein product [Caenorhabditis auriculariae]|uniref:Uncharacterized protein n=1 Tax=Caenorhabditis auriculariae TaxID=2777116 RepID=A0A8S1HIX3_9PELO|nr:unnamed protein product [Caenorhabditis auriculariae]